MRNIIVILLTLIIGFTNGKSELVFYGNSHNQRCTYYCTIMGYTKFNLLLLDVWAEVVQSDDAIKVELDEIDNIVLENRSDVFTCSKLGHGDVLDEDSDFILAIEHEFKMYSYIPLIEFVWHETIVSFSCKKTGPVFYDSPTVLLMTDIRKPFIEYNGVLRYQSGPFTSITPHVIDYQGETYDITFLSSYGFAKKTPSMVIHKGKPHLKFFYGDMIPLANLTRILNRTMCLGNSYPHLLSPIDDLSLNFYHLMSEMKEYHRNHVVEFNNYVNSLYKEVEHLTICQEISIEESEKILAEIYFPPSKKRNQEEITNINEIHTFFQENQKYLYLYNNISLHTDKILCIETCIFMQLVNSTALQFNDDGNVQNDSTEESDENVDYCLIPILICKLVEKISELATTMFVCNHEQAYEAVDLPQLEVDVEENKMFHLM